MPITLECSCGKTLRIADEYAGRRVKCPACGGVVSAPEPEPKFEVVTESARPVAKPVARPTADEDEEPRQKRPRHEEPERPRKRRKRRRESEVSGGDVWRIIKRVLFVLLGGIILIGAIALGADGLKAGHGVWIIRSVLMLVVGGSLLFAGITGKFAGEE